MGSSVRVFFSTQETHCVWKLKTSCTDYNMNNFTHMLPHISVNNFPPSHTVWEHTKGSGMPQTNAGARPDPRTCDMWGCVPDCQWCRVRLRRHRLLLPTRLNATIPESCRREAFAVAGMQTPFRRKNPSTTCNQEKLNLKGPVYSVRNAGRMVEYLQKPSHATPLWHWIGGAVSDFLKRVIWH